MVITCSTISLQSVHTTRSEPSTLSLLPSSLPRDRSRSSPILGRGESGGEGRKSAHLDIGEEGGRRPGRLVGPAEAGLGRC